VGWQWLERCLSMRSCLCVGVGVQHCDAVIRCCVICKAGLPCEHTNMRDYMCECTNITICMMQYNNIANELIDHITELLEEVEDSKEGFEVHATGDGTYKIHEYAHTHTKQHTHTHTLAYKHKPRTLSLTYSFSPPGVIHVIIADKGTWVLNKQVCEQSKFQYDLSLHNI
jgi:hypothetical protein